jgi:hypothetical protein
MLAFVFFESVRHPEQPPGMTARSSQTIPTKPALATSPPDAIKRRVLARRSTCHVRIPSRARAACPGCASPSTAASPFAFGATALAGRAGFLMPSLYSALCSTRRRPSNFPEPWRGRLRPPSRPLQNAPARSRRHLKGRSEAEDGEAVDGGEPRCIRLFCRYSSTLRRRALWMPGVGRNVCWLLDRERQLSHFGPD